MFCDGCGASVEPGQAFCSRCGKQITGLVMAQPRTGRVQGHVPLLGVLWFAISVLNAIGGLVLFILANTLFARLTELGAPPQAAAFLRPLLSAVGILVMAKAAFGFLAGWGLMRREPWARMLALVLAFIALFNIPFGTAIGVYTLWVLLPAQSEQDYISLATAKAAA